MKCAWDVYKVIIFVFAGIASGFTLVSIFPEDASGGSHNSSIVMSHYHEHGYVS